MLLKLIIRKDEKCITKTREIDGDTDTVIVNVTDTGHGLRVYADVEIHSEIMDYNSLDEGTHHSD